MHKIFSKLINHETIKIVTDSKVQKLKSKPSIEELKSIIQTDRDWHDPSMVISKKNGDDLLTISLLQNDEKNISLRVNLHSSKSKIQEEYWICRNGDKSDDIIWVHDMFFATISSFIEPKFAVEVIFELLENHNSALLKYSWLNSNDINWPDELL